MIQCNQEKIQKEQVDTWFNEWKSLAEKIHEAHDRRDRSAGDYMEQGINLYETFILQASNQTHFDVEEEYEILPINAGERLAFIKRRPGQYACYRQLDELFLETKKRCARLRLKK